MLSSSTTFCITRINAQRILGRNDQHFGHVASMLLSSDLVPSCNNLRTTRKFCYKLCFISLLCVRSNTLWTHVVLKKQYVCCWERWNEKLSFQI